MMESSPPSIRAGWRWRDLLLALAIGVACFVVYNANMRAMPAMDTYAARYLPFSILRNHTVDLGPILQSVAQGRQVPAPGGEFRSASGITLGRDGHYVSWFPVLLPVVITPLYLPARSYLNARGWDPLRLDRTARVMEKLVASLIAAASVGLLYLLLRRRAPPSTAALLSLAYAFGTTTWVISGQSLWAHGMAQLLIVATMLLITGSPKAWSAAAAGLFCGMIAANRQPDAILAAALGLYALWWAGRHRLRLIFVAGGLVPAALTLAYHLTMVGHVAGTYGLLVEPEHYNDEILEGLAALLFSPTRGLFIYSPFLLFIPCLLFVALRDSAYRRLNLAIVVAAAAQVLLYAMVDWRQGLSWGPRWLTDMLPMLMWLLTPIVLRLARPARILFGAACAVAVAIQATGAFFYTDAAGLPMLQGRDAERMRPMWHLSNVPFILSLTNGLAPADLLRRFQGNIDLVEVIDVEAGAGVERQIDVAGWALVDARTPSGVSVMVDGRFAAGSNTFFTRPDVVRTTGQTRPAGWRVQVPVGSLTPGRHTIAVLAHGSEREEPRLLGQVAFELAQDSPEWRLDRWLNQAGERAVSMLAARQRPEGSWLTEYTGAPIFETPTEELNTYLNAIMIDIAGPLTSSGPLSEMLTRARGYLRSQIEADGLVRYHGRPDAPGIGVLGCAITPDADDTALAWRLAPLANPALLATALETLHRFRREDGLYRTWLAQPSDYRCIDPGRDPNPADLGIQMHVLMLLARENPPAARSLCQAMTRHADSDDVWTYYAAAPLMLSLRLPDMHRSGCALTLPAARLRTNAPGQDLWMRVAGLLGRLDGGAAGPAILEEAALLLHEIAAQDFAVIHRAPPLVYHNDMSASVRRFYWSRDLGYLLWLRLRHEARVAAARLGRVPQQEGGE